MKHVSERNLEGPGATTGPGWTRVLLAVVAVHLAAVVVPIVLTPLYAILAGGASAGEFAGLASSWLLPVLTLPAALWAVRDARRETAVLNGLLVGVLFYWPHGLPSLALFALIVAAGLARGLLGRSATRSPT